MTTIDTRGMVLAVLAMVDAERYLSAVKKIRLGKKVRGDVYLHFDTLRWLPDDVRDLIVELMSEHDLPMDFDVLKLSRTKPAISLLYYPSFFEDPHPALVKSMTVDLISGKQTVRSFGKGGNPPILHRKEEFLPPNHPDIPEYRELTRREEEEGLYENTKIIGFKKTWDRLVAERGLEYVGHKLVSL